MHLHAPACTPPHRNTQPALTPIGMSANDETRADEQKAHHAPAILPVGGTRQHSHAQIECLWELHHATLSLEPDRISQALDQCMRQGVDIRACTGKSPIHQVCACRTYRVGDLPDCRAQVDPQQT